jgi:hypothetical protein
MMGQLKVAVVSGINTGLTSSAFTKGSSIHSLFSFVSFFAGEVLLQEIRVMIRMNTGSNLIQEDLFIA